MKVLSMPRDPVPEEVVAEEPSRSYALGAPTAADLLRPVVGEAAEVDLGDPAAARCLVEAAARITAVLAARGDVPPHLVVQTGEPPVLAVRTVAAAWRRVARSR